MSEPKRLFLKVTPVETRQTVTLKVTPVETRMTATVEVRSLSNEEFHARDRKGVPS